MVKRKLSLKHNNSVLKVPVRFDSEANIGEFFTRFNAVIKWEHGMREHQTDAMAAAYGKAIMALYALIFGSEWGKQIETWFGSDVTAMVSTVNPFITAFILPDVEKWSAINRKRAMKKFLRERKKAAHAVV